MLFFLLKMDGRVRLQLFLLALIVGSEIIPAAQGLDCYSCDLDLGMNDFKCEAGKNEKDLKECGSCYYDLDDQGKGGVAQRGGEDCGGQMSLDKGDVGYTCALEVSPADACLLKGGPDSTYNKHSACVSAKRNQVQATTPTPEPLERNYYPGTVFERMGKFKRCYCNTNLCNKGPEAKGAGNGNGGGNGGGSVNPSGPDASTEPGAKNSGVRTAPSKGYPLCLVLLVSLWFGCHKEEL